MHYAALIIKDRKVGNYEAREIAGDFLYEHKVCDWYKTEHDGRLFSGDKERIKFKNISKNFDIEPIPIITINSEGDIEESIVPIKFWEFYNFPDVRKELLAKYQEAYSLLFKKFLVDYAEFDAILMDYHA